MARNDAGHIECQGVVLAGQGMNHEPLHASEGCEKLGAFFRVVPPAVSIDLPVVLLALRFDLLLHDLEAVGIVGGYGIGVVCGDDAFTEIGFSLLVVGGCPGDGGRLHSACAWCHPRPALPPRWGGMLG